MRFAHPLLIALLLLSVALPAPAIAAAPRPNILLILADDMGWGDLRCHGNDRLDTPVLDKLRSQSVELDHFYVSPICSPTRSSLLAGRHHLRLRVINTTNGLEVMSGEEVTIAEALKTAGYATGCFGKWHNGSNHPSTARGQGFDEFFGFNGGFFSNYFDPALEHNGVVAPRPGFITDVIADAALAFIERQRAHPFFCYVPFNACHSPMQAPAELFTKYRQRGFAPMEAAVYAMVENLDHNTGRLLAKLDALGLAENTLVLFASDNGPNSRRFNGGMRGAKASVFEGGMRVPCFIRWPGKLDGGKVIAEIAQHVDVLPTLLDFAGVPLPTSRTLDGMSLVPLLRGTAKDWPERTLFELSGRGGKDGTPLPLYPGTARTPTHRWVHDGKQEYLFDLRDDPGETHNLLAQQPALAATLAGAYERWFREATAPTRGKVKRFPITLTDGTELPVPNAELQGGAHFFGKGWDYDWATGFDSPSAAIVWNLDVPRAATYEVEVLHTAKSAGGFVRVEVGGNTVQGAITAAHEPPEIPRPDLVPRWEVPDKVFRPLRVGRIALPAGAHDFKVTATTGVEIQTVKLHRISAAK